MRVAFVSAHFPPNFISGGTLVPSRLAEGLVQRGHETAVFAGRIDDTEPPLSVRVDDGPIPVTWVNITSFTAWDDVRNYENLPVEDLFRRWLSDVNPDVVHFHSLQTLGGSLVSVAAAMGLPTVVTMHDFWWVCSRQFLVDKNMRPCSLVVDAGVCACQSGRDLLEARSEALAPHLQAADVILAPSQITADVLRANGIPADRLRVNENGMVATPAVRDHQPSDVVRFRYTGGPDPMKGAGVIAEALELLHPDRSWRLTVHLPGDADGPLADLVSDGSVVRAAPYSPQDLDAVMADTDVLVLPSVMRETHSIATREALLRGVPVLTSDSLGPEQVIDDGGNGLIVPTGDAAALADAMRRLATDRGLLQRLREGTADFTARSVEDQVVELEEILGSLLAPAPVAEAAWTPTTLLFVVGIDGAPLRYRAQFPAEALQLVGVSTTILHYSDPGVEQAADTADAIVVYRVPATPRVLDVIDRARSRGTPVLFDVDDLIVDPDIEREIPALRLLPPDEATLWMEGVRRYRTTLEHCDAFVGSTVPLVDAVAAATGLPSFLKRNTYGLELARLSDAALQRERDPGPVRIGYLSGTNTHDDDMRSVVTALASVLERFGDTEVWLGGHLPSDPALDAHGERVVRVPFRPWNELPSLLRQIDVNLAPLADLGTFNQAKSAIKWLEAALVATPTVASASDPFIAAVTHGVDGLLVDHPSQWEPAIAELVGDPVRRRSIGAAARRTALVNWSPHTEGRHYLDIVRTVRDSPPRSASAWSDVVVDEPAAPTPIALSPYPPGDGVSVADPAGVAGPSLARKVVWSLRNESPRTVLRRAVGRIRGR